MTSEEVRAAFVWQTMEAMGRVWTDDHCAYTTRQMADEIVRLREQLATVDAEREQAYEVAQQNEQTARRMADRIRELEAQP